MFKGGWNHQLDNNGWAVRIVMRVHFRSLDDHFPDAKGCNKLRLSTNQMVNFHLDHKPINWKTGEIRKLTLKKWWPFGLPGILNHYLEGRNCRMANKKEMLTLQTHSGSIYLVYLLWSAFGRWWSPFGRKILFGGLFFLAKFSNPSSNDESRRASCWESIQYGTSWNFDEFDEWIPFKAWDKNL